MTGALCDYETVLLCVDITYGSDHYITHARVNVPVPYVGGPVYAGISPDPAVVVIMSGTGGDAIVDRAEDLGTGTTISTDDDMAGVLATGSVPYLDSTSTPRPSFGRTGDPVFTVVFNRPSQGDGGFEASSVPEYEGWGETNDGDDDGGPYTSIFTEAVVECALAYIEDRLSSSGFGTTTRLFLVSFSNGLAAASRWLRYTSKTVVAYIDVEGPTDSLEQTVATICYDPLGIVASFLPTTSLGTTLDLAGWQQAVAAEAEVYEALVTTGGWDLASVRRDRFERAFNFMFRPPLEVLAEMEATCPWSSPSDVPLPTSIASARDKRLYFLEYLARGDAFFEDIRDYWADREAYTHLQSRSCPYVRANGLYDHVHSLHYQNRHAARALVAAGSATTTAGGVTDVYAADQSYYDDVGDGLTPDPTALSSLGDLAGAVEANEYDQFPTWPDYSPVDGDRAHVEVDLVRWAVGRFT